jgi:hypothetical protein
VAGFTMKISASLRSDVRATPARSPLFPALVWLLASGWALATTASGDDSPYRINVSSTVERAYTRFSKEPYRDHGRWYNIISAAPVEENPLARPVNETALLTQLRGVLALHGFHEAEPGHNPEIVLTVLYGRSHLLNPYTKESVDIDANNGVPTASIGETEARTLSMPGGQTRLIAASAEKLFIAVCAWKFPETAQEKPKELWRTIVNVDDPDEDLNLVSEKMLRAASTFFDHPIETPEVTFSSDLPEGHVKLGTPTEIGPDKHK